MDIAKSIQYVGLSEKEAKVYLAMLQSGPNTAYYIAKRSQLKRPTVYVIIEEMVEKGIAFKSPKGKSQSYGVIAPGELIDLARRKLEYAEAALPELEALSNSKKDQVKVMYFEGIEGIKDLYARLFKNIKAKEHIGFYAHTRDSSKEVVNFFIELNKIYKKRGIVRHGITVDDKSIDDFLSRKETPNEMLKLLKLPPKFYDSNVSIEIYGNYVQIFSHRYLQAILIENPDIAQTMSQIFYLVWNGYGKKTIK